MKVKVSISIKESTLKEVKKTLKNSVYRNKSHFIEFATEKLLKEGKNDRN
ncbi:hypothetical protein J4230_04275 [Candidatus Woesearchaeota archaeon]|nr:hypothetical protein [Candidatus Woesearchaeota archaeon]